MSSLITFANSLDPDQARHNVRPDLDPNYLTLMVFLKEFFEKVDNEKNQQTTKKHEKLPRMQRVKLMDKYVHKFFVHLGLRLDSIIFFCLITDGTNRKIV